MATTALKPSALTEPPTRSAVEEKIQQLRELFADAPESGKRRWRTRFPDSIRRLRTRHRRWKVPAGSAAVREGLGVDRDRPVRTRRCRASARVAAAAKATSARHEQVGTVHDMRFVFLDNDTVSLRDGLRRRLGHLYRGLRSEDSRRNGRHLSL